MAKGIGESGPMPTALAIASALAGAVGVRLNALPLTREHVRTALTGRKRARPEGGTTCEYVQLKD